MKDRFSTVTENLAPDSYTQFLADLKSRIQAAQFRASLAVNRELVLLYWQIGRDILDRQNRESWGGEGNRPFSDRSQTRISRLEGILAPEPEIYAGLRRSVARGNICASGACTNHLVPQSRDSRKRSLLLRSALRWTPSFGQNFGRP